MDGSDEHQKGPEIERRAALLIRFSVHEEKRSYFLHSLSDERFILIG